MCFSGHVGACFATMHEMPVFEPNDYFWAHHWDETKEEKWQAYARVMRKIMCQQGGFVEYNCSLEDKYLFKATVRNVKMRNVPTKVSGYKD